MIIKCPKCNASLKYDIATKSMKCEYCLNTFNVNSEDIHYDRDASEDDLIEFDIYTCTTCGAELIINGVETSTYCAYCGQPTIVWNRVSKQQKPKYIVPFQISKEEALKSIKKRLKFGFFIPKQIKNFKVDLLRGIYIPFWIYEIDYHDRQFLQGEVNGGKTSKTVYYLREASTTFSGITVDASKSLNDVSSQRLEPYSTNEMKPFDINYLSGFYADCNDEDNKKMDDTAANRAMELFNKKIEDSINASEIKILKNSPKYKIVNHTYALLPAWFLVFNNDNKNYTIMMNGQTGKIVGAVPFNKKKAIITFSVLFPLITGALAWMLPFILKGETDSIIELVLVLIFVGVGVFLLGVSIKDKYKVSQQLTTSNGIENFVSDRQEEK